MITQNECTMISMVQNIVEKHGCSIKIDFDNKTFEIDGPEDKILLLIEDLSDVFDFLGE